jgi:2'-5' RNA ligase
MYSHSSPSSLRRQLTLFVPPEDAVTIEQVRQRFNKVQFDLIKAHVTLCREDELEDIDRVSANIRSLTYTEIQVTFARIERFDGGKGLFIPATGDATEFHAVRKHILAGLVEEPEKKLPHITLMHPRNATCTDEIFADVEKRTLPSNLRFTTISLIEQNKGGPWKTLQEFHLGNNT